VAFVSPFADTTSRGDQNGTVVHQATDGATSAQRHLRSAADIVDKILRGAKAGDVPIQQATTFNLRTAKALGLTIPPSLVLRADEVLR